MFRLFENTERDEIKLTILLSEQNQQEQHESKKSNFLTENDRLFNMTTGGISAAAAAASNGSSSLADNNDDNNPENDIEKSLTNRMYVLRELLTTEETYVSDLSMIVDGYIREIRDPDSDIPIPEDLKGGKERMIFGNVEAIYEWHRE